MIRPVTILAALGSFTSVLQAQGDCFPAGNSNEAKTFAIFAVPLAFGPIGPARSEAGRVELGFELSYLPNVDPATATPTVCRPGKGPENTDLLFAVPRPRVSVGLGAGFAIEGSWVPPARLNDVEANLFGVAVSYGTGIGGSAGIVVRAHATLGRINAPITCPDQELANQVSECFQGTRSDDRYHPNVAGLEALVHWRGRVQPYLGAGYNRLMPRFQVHFVNSQGSLDDRKVEVDLNRLAVLGGVRWQATPAWSLAGELYATPGDAVTVRTAVRLGL
ncbi:MAG: hypothetical protein FJ206_01515 [Gemmatimonadetes bacterium]|nr:hypothetical protein [Gemmatimonadota bacterium]